MSLSTLGVWQPGVWATTVWTDGVWYEVGGTPTAIYGFWLINKRRRRL